MPPTTLLTLALDPVSQERFERLRQQHYPPGLNRVPAHVSLLHQLPGGKETEHLVRETACRMAAFSVEVTGLRSLGRGVACTLASAELQKLHSELAQRFEPRLIPQDRQRFHPHLVVQNKATPEQARELFARLQASFVPHKVQATGVLWWEYLGGPWQLLEQLDFAATAPGSPA